MRNRRDNRDLQGAIVKMKKKAQEEMVGFVLIIIIVAVIALVLLSLSSGNRQEESVESRKVFSFLNSVLKYTTECKKNGNEPNLSLKDLISHCAEGNKSCEGWGGSCELLNSTLHNILNTSWDVGDDSFYNGYELNIVFNEEEDHEDVGVLITKGNTDGNSKGSSQFYSKKRNTVDIYFQVYS